MPAFIAGVFFTLSLFFALFVTQPSPLVVPYGVAVAGAEGSATTAAYFAAATAQLNAGGTFGEFVAVDWAAWGAGDAPDGAVLVTTLNGELALRYIPGAASVARQSALLEDVNLPLVPVSAPHSQDVLLASVLYGAGRCELAAPYAQAVADVAAVVVPLQVAAGNCYLVRGDRAQAIAQFTPLAAGVPTAANNLAWLLLNEDPEAAFALLDGHVADTAASGDIAHHANALARRAAFHAQAFNFDAAIADISAAIALRPGHAPYYKQRGDHIFLIYEWDRVLADYNAAILLDPAYADAYYARGVLFYTQGPRTRALADFQRFVELAPGDPRAATAAENIASIQAELDALGGDDTGPFGPSN